MGKAPQSEMELPAKRWEVAALDSRLQNQDTMLKGISDKQDRLLERQVTTTQLTDGIALAKSYTDDKIEKMNLIYGPVLSDTKWLRRILVGAIVATLLNFGYQILR